MRDCSFCVYYLYILWYVLVYSSYCLYALLLAYVARMCDVKLCQWHSRQGKGDDFSCDFVNANLCSKTNTDCIRYEQFFRVSSMPKRRLRLGPQTSLGVFSVFPQSATSWSCPCPVVAWSWTCDGEVVCLTLTPGQVTIKWLLLAWVTVCTIQVHN